MKTLSSGHLRVLKDLSVIERCPLLEGNLKNRFSYLELNVLSAIQSMSFILDVRYWEVSLYKRRFYGLSINLKLIENYLTDRKQRVILNGQTSLWERVLSGFLQGSVSRPLFFLTYIHDLPDGIKSICKIFGNETSLHSKCQFLKIWTGIKRISQHYQLEGLPVVNKL